MEYSNEIKNCQNCQKDFTVESEDFNFYEKIKVPPPTWCPWCRFIRRMSWRNERALYKRACDLCTKSMISMYASDAPFPVYCRECWYGDGWDSVSYGRDYDFSRPFFDQLSDLFNTVPHVAIWQRNAINSDYCNWVAESRNVYLSASVVENSENVFYSKSIDNSKDILDSFNIKNSERCYENIDSDHNYNSQFLTLSRNCVDSYFLLDCVNCSNCFMSSNLRNKQYYFRNQPYSQDEYFKALTAIGLHKRTAREGLILEYIGLKQNAIFRYANNVKCVDSSGNNLLNCKNCISSSDVSDSEDTKYSYRVIQQKDSMDFNFGGWAELTYEYISGLHAGFNVKFSTSCMSDLKNIEYSYNCLSSSDIFGCYGLRNKKFHILNKEYTKEEYSILLLKIKEQMESLPYVDIKGRLYKYGEFFPTELSPHSYNESLAQEFDPLTKKEAELRGYQWKEQEEKNFSISLGGENMPETIDAVEESILNEVLGCAHKEECPHQCTKAYKITSGELQFYKKHNIPLPDKCPNCRYYERLKMVLSPKLWHRQCMNSGCQNEFETPYAPDRPEKVYCESCYNKEVY